MALVSLGSLVKKTLSAKTWQARLLNEWPNIVGPLHEQMRIEKIERDCLVIGVFDPHWMHELFMLAPTILETIKKATGHNHITHLRFIYVTKKSSKKNTIVTPKNHKKNLKELSPHHEQVLTRVQSDELRTALRSFFTNCVS